MFNGIVIRGEGVGRTLGYPTANLDTPRRKIDLDAGVYAVNVFLNRLKYTGALAIQDKPWKVEVHLLSYVGDDFYGAYLEIDPIQKVSEMCSYDSLYELKEKIEKDMEMVRGVFE